MKYEKVTAVEYQEKKLRMFNSLGRTSEGCNDVSCAVCPLGAQNNGIGRTCGYLELLNPLKAIQIIMDYKIPVDWSKVEVDTPILVRGAATDDWKKRHFARVEDGEVYAWVNGRTSWTEDIPALWKYAKLEGAQDEN